MADYKVLFTTNEGNKRDVVVSTESPLGFSAAIEQVKEEYFFYEPVITAVELIENPTDNWEDQLKTVQLTNKQWSNLGYYLLMTTKYREGERDTWKSLDEELEADGVTKKFPNAESNFHFWEEMIELVELANKAIDERR